MNDQIYRVIFENTGTRGVRKQFYTKVKNLIEQYGVYRTYDYEEVRKSQVFLEPIVLPKDFREELGRLVMVSQFIMNDELNKLLEILVHKTDKEDEIVICVDGDDDTGRFVLDSWTQQYIHTKTIKVYQRKLETILS